MEIIFDATSFIKRVDRELTFFMVESSITDIIANLYYPETDYNFMKEEFFNAYMAGEVDKRMIRTIIRTKDFQWWVEEPLQEKINKFLENLIFDEENTLRIYRAIKTNYDWVEKAAKAEKIKLGVCWSFDYNGAIPYYGDSEAKNKYIFFGRVKPRDIDWHNTILFNLSESYSHEKEIRLFENRKIRDFYVEQKGELFTKTFGNKKKIKS